MEQVRVHYKTMKQPVLLRQSDQPGQVAIIILLVMVVLLVVVLSLASRTTQEVYLSGQETESTRVFNAAEAGAEEALGNESNFTTSTVTQNSPVVETNFNGEDINYTVSPQNELTTYLQEGMSATVDLDPDGNDSGITGTIPIQWATDGGCTDASVIISVYDNTNHVRHLAFSPTCAASAEDNFTDSSSGSGGYKNRHSLSVTTADLLVRIKAVYNGTDLSVSGANLPVQSHLVRSEAFSPDDGETRAVQVSRSLPAPPSILDYSVYSGTDLIKN